MHNAGDLLVAVKPAPAQQLQAARMYALGPRGRWVWTMKFTASFNAGFIEKHHQTRRRETRPEDGPCSDD